MRTRDLKKLSNTLKKMNEEYTKSGISAITEAVKTTRNGAFVFKKKPIAYPLYDNAVMADLSIDAIRFNSNHRIVCDCKDQNNRKYIYEIDNLSMNYEDVLDYMVATMEMSANQNQ